MSKAELIQDIIEDLARCQSASSYSQWQKIGLSRAQLGMLFVIHHHQQANVKKISENLGITKSAVTQLMEPLVDQGLVKRHNDPKDRRVAHLELTTKGIKMLEKVNKLKFAGLRSALDSLDAQELQAMAALHTKMTKSLQAKRG